MPKEKTYVEVQEENSLKLDRYALYQQARVKAAGKHLPSPIIKNKDGSLQWLNREQRRRAKIK